MRIRFVGGALVMAMLCAGAADAQPVIKVLPVHPPIAHKPRLPPYAAPPQLSPAVLAQAIASVKGSKVPKGPPAAPPPPATTPPPPPPPPIFTLIPDRPVIPGRSDVLYYMNVNYIPNQGGLGAVEFPPSGPAEPCSATTACNVYTMSAVDISVYAGALNAGALYLLDCTVHAQPGTRIMVQDSIGQESAVAPISHHVLLAFAAASGGYEHFRIRAAPTGATASTPPGPNSELTRFFGCSLHSVN